MDVRDSFNVSTVRNHLEKQDGNPRDVRVRTHNDVTVFEVYPEEGTAADTAITDETRAMLNDTYDATIERRETMGDGEDYLDIRISGLLDDTGGQ